MGDVRLLVKRLALGGKSQQVEAKAFEYLRLASARLGPSGLGKAEVCKAAVCVDLACTTLQVSVDATTIALGSGVTGLIYRNARAQLQKVLGVCVRASPRDLVFRFACARLELPLRNALATFKERFLASLPPGDRTGVDCATPAFLAATFFLLGRRHRVKVAKDRLLAALGLTSVEFGRAVALVEGTIPDLVGAPEEKGSGGGSGKKRKASGDGEAAEEGEGAAEDAGEAREELGEQQEQQQEEERGRKAASRKKRRKKALTEAALREAVLEFAATEVRQTRGAAARVANEKGAVLINAPA